MQQSQAEYFAVFDADFRPDEDFLEKSIPVMEQNKNIAAYQSAWAFYNSNESTLTQIQEIFSNTSRSFILKAIEIETESIATRTLC